MTDPAPKPCRRTRCDQPAFRIGLCRDHYFDAVADARDDGPDQTPDPTSEDIDT